MIVHLNKPVHVQLVIIVSRHLCITHLIEQITVSHGIYKDSSPFFYMSFTKIGIVKYEHNFHYYWYSLIIVYGFKGEKVR